jgi:hypothetical protein
MRNAPRIVLISMLFDERHHDEQRHCDRQEYAHGDEH